MFWMILLIQRSFVHRQAVEAQVHVDGIIKQIFVNLATRRNPVSHRYNSSATQWHLFLFASIQVHLVLAIGIKRKLRYPL